MGEADGATSTNGSGGGGAAALKDQGNELFKAGNYLKAAATYTQAIKLEPNNPTLYSNRAAAFLHLVKLNKALADAEMTVALNAQWEKGYFRKGSVLEAMERYDDAISAFQEALKHNPQNLEVSKKIKRLNQLVREKKRAVNVENLRSNIDISKPFEQFESELAISAIQGALKNNPQNLEVSKKIKRLNQLAREKKRAVNVENLRSNIDISKPFEPFKSELDEKCGDKYRSEEMFFFVIEVIGAAIKMWQDTSTVLPRVNFLLDKDKTDTTLYAPVVVIDQAIDSIYANHELHTHIRKYALDSNSKAACMVVPKSDWILSCYPTGQGSRRGKLARTDGFFVQFESPVLRKIWFVPSSTEMGHTVCKDPWLLDMPVHEVVSCIFGRIEKKKLRQGYK